MIFPRLEDARKLAAKGTAIPICKVLLADTETPVSVWMKLFRGEPYSFLLESVTGGETVARYSFIGGAPFMIFRANGAQWQVEGKNAGMGSGDPLEKLRGIMSQFCAVHVPGLPRFCGGAVGFMGYDAVRLWEKIPDRHEASGLLDEMLFAFYQEIIAFDTKEHRVLLITNIFTCDGMPIDAAYHDAIERLHTLERLLAKRSAATGVSIAQTAKPDSNFERRQYEQAVERCKEYIAAGDIFQAVLSQRFTVQVEAEPFDLYRILRIVNPSPYMYFLRCGGASIIGASPEMLVRVEDRIVEVRPIAGTRRRGASTEEDEALAIELLADPKERAEHVMLVDLGRNDVGKVSQSATVKVDQMMHIERYSHVMHIVSNVTGKLNDSCDAIDALRACFPAGTLSGAPKIRAMEIIDELELARRGLYGGALGYLDFRGNLDSCIVIRTIIYKGNTAYIQAGAGIVADSVPAREFEETVNKAGALFAAISNARAIVGAD